MKTNKVSLKEIEDFSLILFEYFTFSDDGIFFISYKSHLIYFSFTIYNIAKEQYYESIIIKYSEINSIKQPFYLNFNKSKGTHIRGKYI